VRNKIAGGWFLRVRAGMKKTEINPTEVPWALDQAPKAGVFAKKMLEKAGEGAKQVQIWNC